MAVNLPQTKAIERADNGLRAYFGKIYQYMAASLTLSGLTAYLSTQEPLLSLLYTRTAEAAKLSVIGWVAFLAPFALIFMIQNAVRKINAAKASAYFWLFAALMGLSMGSVFTVYVPASVIQTFLITAATFLGLSFWASNTQKDLSGLGSFMFMGLIGIIIAMVVNIFLGSSLLSFVVSVLGVIIFAGFIAYDTQRLKNNYYAAQQASATGIFASDAKNADKAGMENALAVEGALSLYLDFINLFFYLLRFLGDRR